MDMLEKFTLYAEISMEEAKRIMDIMSDPHYPKKDDSNALRKSI